VQSACPGIPVEAIDMKLYGRMDGKGVLEAAKKLIA
jgi:PTS system cellobiose-specific IIB component